MFNSSGTNEKYFRVINKIGDDTSKHLKILTKNIMEHEKNLSDNNITDAVSKIAAAIRESSIPAFPKSISFSTDHMDLPEVNVNIPGIETELAGLATSINNVAKAIDYGAKSLEAIAGSILKASSKSNGKGNSQENKSGD